VSVFDYLRVSTWDEAVARLHEADGDARVIAGGQSLVPMVTLRLAAPSTLIDVNEIDARAPFIEDGWLILDSMTRHKTLVADPVVQQAAPLLAHAARLIGNVRVRNRGTLGGSLAHADPTSEIAAVLLALDAEVRVLGPAGERTIPIDDFLISYLTTALEFDEVVTGVRLRTKESHTWAFHEVVGRYSDFATVSVTVVMTPAVQGLPEIRVVLGGVSDRPVLVAPEVLRPLVEGPGGHGLIGEVAKAIASSVEPSSDLHASAEYRRTLVAVHTGRLLEQVLSSEGGNS
jgi:carbon-monoxide dehydrogenase medium subunit